MLNESSAVRLCQQYSQGKRQFQNLDLEQANLAKASLSQIDLSNSKLDNINLGQADLSHASLIESSLVKANLSRANLTRANLTGSDLYKANLTGANIAGASFVRANLHRTNFSLAKLSVRKDLNSDRKVDSSNIDSSNLVSFHRANLVGAFLFGVDLSLADLKGAIYNKDTNFPANFDPVKAGMILEEDKQELNLNKSLVYFNKLFSQSQRYLGLTISGKYFNDSRPNLEWLNLFQINGDREIYFTKNVLSLADRKQAKYFQQWIDNFIASCSKVIKDFPEPETDDDGDEELFGGFF